jgi:hypothetical protein
MANVPPIIEFKDREAFERFSSNLYYEEVTAVSPDGTSVTGNFDGYDAESNIIRIDVEDKEGEVETHEVELARVKVF